MPQFIVFPLFVLHKLLMAPPLYQLPLVKHRNVIAEPAGGKSPYRKRTVGAKLRFFFMHRPAYGSLPLMRQRAGCFLKEALNSI